MLPYGEIRQQTDYPTLATNQNQYTFVDFYNKLLIHQQTQGDYYNNFQVTPISQVTNTPDSLDPSNLSVENRFTYWNHQNLNNQENNNLYQNRLNNPFYWYANTPAKSTYYNQYEFNPYFNQVKYMSPIEQGKLQSFQEYHRMELR